MNILINDRRIYTYQQIFEILRFEFKLYDIYPIYNLKTTKANIERFFVNLISYKTYKDYEQKTDDLLGKQRSV